MTLPLTLTQDFMLGKSAAPPLPASLRTLRLERFRFSGDTPRALTRDGDERKDSVALTALARWTRLLPADAKPGPVLEVRRPPFAVGNARGRGQRQ